MARKTGNQGALYLGGFDVGSDVSAVDTTQSVDTPETTGLGSTAKSYIAGLQDGQVAWKGFFSDTSVTGLDTVIAPLLGTLPVSTFLPGGDAQGARSFCGQAELVKDYKISAPVAGVVVIAADFVCSGGLDDSFVIQPKLQITGTGSTQDGTSLDQAAATTNGGRAYFHVLAVDAAATVTIKLRHSADNSTFADLATSTLTGSAVGADSVAIAGTVNRYVLRRVTTTSAKNVTIQSSLARY